jgi:hypothetical protein
MTQRVVGGSRNNVSHKKELPKQSVSAGISANFLKSQTLLKMRKSPSPPSAKISISSI